MQDSLKICPQIQMVNGGKVVQINVGADNQGYSVTQTEMPKSYVYDDERRQLGYDAFKGYDEMVAFLLETVRHWSYEGYAIKVMQNLKASETSF